MSPIIAHFIHAGIRYGVRAITYGLARRFVNATPAEKFAVMGEAWETLVVPPDGERVPPVDDVPAKLVDQVIGLASDNDADFLEPPQPSSGPGG